MRVNQEDFERVSSLLQADKAVMSDGCKALVLQDLTEKLSEFFDLCVPPKMTMEKQGEKYRVELVFTAENIKKFNVLK